MNILRTARVVVVDDIESEATPLLLALTKFGIGAWYFNGDVEHLPKAPLTGVRVVFLDLRLSGADGSSDAVRKFSNAISVLEHIVGKSKNNVGIVYWTKNEEDIAAFERQLKEDLVEFVPTFTKRIDNKTTLLGSQGGADCPLLQIVQDSLQVNCGTDLLLQWEQAVHDAASETSNRLAELADSHVGANDHCLMQILTALAKSAGAVPEAGDTLNVIRLFESLNTIHSDHLEHLTQRRSGASTSATALTEEVAKNHRLPDRSMAQLNGIVLTARSTQDDPDFQPGALYTPNADIGVKCPHHHARMPMNELSNSILDFQKDRDFEVASRQSKSQKLGPEKMQEGTELAFRRSVEISEECEKVLVEISPACDFAQGKRSTVRFVGGLLVPEKYFALIKTGAYLKVFEPMFLHELGGTWQVVFNSRYVFGLAEPSSKLESYPRFRLRNPPLVDLISWVASQSARPGYISLRNPD